MNISSLIDKTSEQSERAAAYIGTGPTPHAADCLDARKALDKLLKERVKRVERFESGKVEFARLVEKNDDAVVARTKSPVNPDDKITLVQSLFVMLKMGSDDVLSDVNRAALEAARDELEARSTALDHDIGAAERALAEAEYERDCYRRALAKSFYSDVRTRACS